MKAFTLHALSSAQPLSLHEGLQLEPGRTLVRCRSSYDVGASMRSKALMYMPLRAKRSRGSDHWIV